MAQSFGGVIDDLRGRMQKLEQRLTSPEMVGVNTANPIFQSITVGDETTQTFIDNDPQIPSSLAAVPGRYMDDVFMDVSWVAPGPQQYEYQLQIFLKDTLAGTYALVQSVRATTNNIRVHNLLPDATYGIQLYAVNSLGLLSDPVPAAPLDVVMAADTTIPAAPTGLALFSGLGSLTVTWNPNTEDDVAKGRGMYDVQIDTVSTFDSPNLQDKRITGNVLTWGGLTPGTTYYVRVAAIDSSSHQGPWCAWLQATVGTISSTSASDGVAPATSPAPTVIPGFTSLFVKWTAIANADPVTYDVHLSTVNGFAPSGATLAGSVDGTLANIKTLPGTATPLTAGVTYYIKIVARDRDGSGPVGAQGSGVPSLINGATDIVANSIVANDILAGTITTTLLAANAVTAAKIAAQTITANEIASRTIVADRIAIGTLTGDLISANTIDAGSIKTSSLSSASITITGSGALVIGNPGPGAGQSGILFNSTGFSVYSNGALTAQFAGTGSAIFSGQLSAASGTFTGTLQGATIVATQLPTSVYSANAVVNYNFEDVHPITGEIKGWNYKTSSAGTTFGLGNWVTTGTSWAISSSSVTPISGYKSMIISSTDNTGGAGTSSTEIGITVGEKWHIQGDFMQSKTATGGQYRGVYFTVLFYDANGVLITGTPAAPLAVGIYNIDGTLYATPTPAMSAGRMDLIANAVPIDSVVRRVIATIIAPPGASLMRIAVAQWTVATANATTTTTRFDGMMARKALDSSYFSGGQIIGGTITGTTIQTSSSGPRILLGPAPPDALTYSSDVSDVGLILYGREAPTVPARITNFEYITQGAADNNYAVRIVGGVQNIPATETIYGTYENAIFVFPRDQTDEQSEFAWLQASTGYNIMAGQGIVLQVAQHGDPAQRFDYAIGALSLKFHGFGGGVASGSEKQLVLAGATYWASCTAIAFKSDELRVTNYASNGFMPLHASNLAASSSRSVKTDVRDRDHLSIVRAAPSKAFRYHHSVGYSTEMWRHGPMVEDLPPDLHHPTSDINGNPLAGIDLFAQVGVLWGAVHQLTVELEERGVLSPKKPVKALPEPHYAPRQTEPQVAMHPRGNNHVA